MDEQTRYRQASIKTVENLKTVAVSANLRELSRLSLPEVEAVSELVARLVPAGNVPGMVLSALARLPGTRLSPEVVQRDIGLLFKGVEQTLDRSLYTAFFAGPAAVLWGYQNLLKLAGKPPEAAFPDGTWQFYVEYALREDTARHDNETHGFDTALRQHSLQLTPVDRAAAWALAVIHILHQYSALLTNEWRERVLTNLLAEVSPQHASLYRTWQKRIPYRRGPEAASQTYPAYRRAQFEACLGPALAELPADRRQAWEQRCQAAEAADLPAYLRQMSLLAYLSPDAYKETRRPLPSEQTYLGLIYQGSYYLLPTCAPEGRRPAEPETVRGQIAALFGQAPVKGTAALQPLARLRRAALAELRPRLSPVLQRELALLRQAPVLLNLDRPERRQPLNLLRQAERGVGDHPLTIFDTGESIIFDQSHIFFDGAWGAALAEILTNEALAWAVYLKDQPPAAAAAAPYRLQLTYQPADRALLRQAPRAMLETGAETEAVDAARLLEVRKRLKQRNDQIQLTVNDLLVLYRAIHAAIYTPNPVLVEALRQQPAAQAALEMLAAQPANPAILIPIDASQQNPRTRLYPLCFEAPLAELDLLDLHRQTLAALDGQQAEFTTLRRAYLAALAGFGAVLGKAKEIAGRGEGASVGAIKLLAHLPAPVQRLLDRLPEQFSLLNDMLKGREVFSNTGAVAPGSTLVRFISAKDDNELKTLVWGVMTDANGVLRVTLRDFRPYVAPLLAAKQADLAAWVARDYLAAYARGLNQYCAELLRLTLAHEADA